MRRARYKRLYRTGKNNFSKGLFSKCVGARVEGPELLRCDYWIGKNSLKVFDGHRPAFSRPLALVLLIRAQPFLYKPISKRLISSDGGIDHQVHRFARMKNNERILLNTFLCPCVELAHVVDGGDVINQNA